MGNNNGTEKSNSIKPICKIDIEVTAEKIIQHLILFRDRKINELAYRERELKEKIKHKTIPYEEICFELIPIVNFFKYIKASKIIIRYCQVIKEHSGKVVASSHDKNFNKIKELVPYIEGVIWSSDKFNLLYIKEFTNIFNTYFTKEIFQKLKESNFLDKELQDCFTSIEPNPSELNDYLKGFIERYQIDVKLPFSDKKIENSNVFETEKLSAQIMNGFELFKENELNNDLIEKIEGEKNQITKEENNEFDDIIKHIKNPIFKNDKMLKKSEPDAYQVNEILIKEENQLDQKVILNNISSSYNKDCFEFDMNKHILLNPLENMTTIKDEIFEKIIVRNIPFDLRIKELRNFKF